MDNLSLSTASSDKIEDLFSGPSSHRSNYDNSVKSSPSKSPMQSPSRRKGMRIEGHRGAGALEPENTLKAFQRAIDLAIDGVELDVWISKDGIPIVVHGTDEGLVHFKDTSLTTFVHNINSKDLKDWKLPNDESIPTLEEVLLLCKDRINVNIELKEESERVVKPTLALVERLGMFEQVCFSSFIHSHKVKLEEVRKEMNIEHALEFGFLVHEAKEFGEFVEKAHSGDALNINIELLLEHEAEVMGQIAKARAKNMKIKFYFGFDIEENHEIYKRLEDMKVDALIINHPLKSIDFLSLEMY